MAKARSEIGNAVRSGQDPTPARQHYACLKLERAIREANEGIAPITEEQRVDMLRLLMGGTR